MCVREKTTPVLGWGEGDCVCVSERWDSMCWGDGGTVRVSERRDSTSVGAGGLGVGARLREEPAPRLGSRGPLLVCV